MTKYYKGCRCEDETVWQGWIKVVDDRLVESICLIDWDGVEYNPPVLHMYGPSSLDKVIDGTDGWVVEEVSKESYKLMKNLSVPHKY